MARRITHLWFLDKLHEWVRDSGGVDWTKNLRADLPMDADIDAFLARWDEKQRGPYGALKPGPPAPDYEMGDQYGAPPEKLAIEVQRLLAIYNAADLRRIMHAVKKQIAEPPRSSRGKKGSVDWSNPWARRARLEIVALQKAHDLKQLDAYVRWQKYRQKTGWGYPRLVEIEPQSLRAQVFDR